MTGAATGTLPPGARETSLPVRVLWPVARVTGSVALTFLGLLLVTFLIGRVVPIDPVLAAVGDRAPAAVYERVKHELGLHLPLWQQFWIYLRKVLSGDFGRSVLTSNLVLTDIRRFFPATLELATVATLIGVTLGIPMGVFAAVRRGQWPDQVVRVVSLLGYSVPVFWLGLMGLLLFYGRLGWVAGPGRLDVAFEDLVPTVTGVVLLDSALAGEWEVFGNAFRHVILPASILGYLSLAYLARMTRSFMLARARAGVHHHRPDQGALRAAHRVAPCPRERHGAAHHGRWPSRTRTCSRARCSRRPSSPGRASASTSPARS